MPTITIDGRSFEVPQGITILQAALAQGIEIPHYCYHPGLEIAGNCRICLVEVEKNPRPQIACNTFVADGMVVHTRSEKTLEWQRAVMEFLLINHPLDCPICDQAGECKLQDYSFRFGKPTTRFEEEKEHGPKRRELGPHVVFDWERCIKCTRCIRFCEEVPGTGELDMFLRGVREEVSVFPGRPLDNAYSGNVVDICPVGALTLKEFRFKSRVWFVTNVPSTCAGCARGCSVNVGVFRGEIYRITPRENQAVNRWWICDEGRLWGERLRAGETARLSGPRGAGAEGTDPWGAAHSALVQALKAARGRVRVLASSRLTNEEAFVLARLAAGPLGGAPIHLPVHEQGADDELLVRQDKAPNRRGVTTICEAIAGKVGTVAELEQALRADQVDAVLAIGPGLVGPDPRAVIETAAFERAKLRVVLDAYASPLSERATHLLPVLTYAESTGSYVNFAGRVQHVERGFAPRADARPTLLLLGDLLHALAPQEPVDGLDAVRRRLSAEVASFGSIRWDELPASEGQDLAGADAAAAACKPTGAARKMLGVGWTPVGR
jgi:NADH-quinone oxidoreductase subunit G